jgi:class 3 adenylate cyclase
MSFKAKTILTLIFLSLAPYIITMMLLGNAYKHDYENRITENMRYQLDATTDQLDYQLDALEKDMRFLSSLDTMNDVLTGDLDKRITTLLAAKKQDLQLEGDFDVLDNNHQVIASSNISRVGKKSQETYFIEVPIHSTFIDEEIGSLTVNYKLTTLTRFLPSSEYLTYSLSLADQESSPEFSQNEAIVVTQSLESWPALTVALSQDREFALDLLSDIQGSFQWALLIGTATITIIAFLIASQLVNPILMLSSTAHSISNTHDYSKRVTINRTDEIGQLAKSFNLMIESMQGMIARLKQESENKLQLAQEKNRAEMLESLSTKLSRYLSPQIYESIFSGEQDVTLNSSRKKLTIFFSDIVGFTDITDQMESEDLTQLLNQYLSEMTEIALKFGATVDKYIGDAIMIFFGDPKSLGVKEDAVRCIEMAICMQERIGQLQAEWRQTGFTKPFSIRVGIHTGYCTVGNFGTDSRMDYTIVGSAVNLASRIESNAEADSVYISEETYSLVKNEIDAIQTTSFLPKGFTNPVNLYKVLPANGTENYVELSEPGVELRYQLSELTKDSKVKIQTELNKLLDS